MAQGWLRKHCERQYVEICVQRYPLRKKEKGVTNSMLYQQSLKLMLHLCSMGGVRGSFVLVNGILHTAYCILRVPLVALRPYFVYLRVPRPYNCTPRGTALGLRRGVAAVGDELKSRGVAVVGVVMPCHCW